MGMEQLRYHLGHGRIDVYRPDEVSPKTGKSRLERFLKDKELQKGTTIRIRIKDKIYGTAVIKNPIPYTLPPNEWCDVWKSAIDLENIVMKEPPEDADCYPNHQASHRLSRKGKWLILMENRIQTENQLKDLYFKYSWCLLKITVEDKLGKLQVGTAFHIGNGLIATSRQLVENKHIKSIEPEEGAGPVVIKKTCLSKNEQNPVAILQTDFSLEKSFKLVSFNLNDKTVPSEECKASYLPLEETLDDCVGKELILTKCLIIGYPQIPKVLQSTLFAVATYVNAAIYSDSRPYVHYILSSVPREGLDGAPVISEYGFGLGMFTTPFTELGTVNGSCFSAAVSVQPFYEVFDEYKLRPEGISDEFWNGSM